jgi:hypothetical protein
MNVMQSLLLLSMHLSLCNIDISAPLNCSIRVCALHSLQSLVRSLAQLDPVPSTRYTRAEGSFSTTTSTSTYQYINMGLTFSKLFDKLWGKKGELGQGHVDGSEIAD